MAIRTNGLATEKGKGTSGAHPSKYTIDKYHKNTNTNRNRNTNTVQRRDGNKNEWERKTHLRRRPVHPAFIQVQIHKNKYIQLETQIHIKLCIRNDFDGQAMSLHHDFTLFVTDAHFTFSLPFDHFHFHASVGLVPDLMLSECPKKYYRYWNC